jgi:L-malate glycosyltransferase
MRIDYLADAYTGPAAGTEKQLMLLIRGMVDRGHDVRLFVLRHTPYTQSVEDFPCPIECLNVGSMASVEAVRRMVRFRSRLRRDSIDVVHAFFNDVAILAPIFLKTPRNRVLTSRRDMGFWYDRKVLAALRLANRRADGIVCNSRAVADQVRWCEGTPADRVSIIYNGVEPSAPTADLLESPPTAGFVPALDDLNVVLVANLRRIKRIEDVVKAAARVIHEAPACRFWIVGAASDERYAASLQELVQTLGVADAVRFLGPSPDPGGIIRHCQVGVLTSESEGLSNTLLEYMSAGLPIVCSDVGGNPELVQNDVNGLLFACGDSDTLADAILRLRADSDLRDRMGRAALERIDSLSVGAMLDAHERLYAEGLPVKADALPLHTPIRYRTVTATDLAAVIDMLGNATFKGLIWDWQFRATTDEVQPVAAYAGDRLIGFNGLIGVDVQFDGERVPAAWSCDFIVAPDYRRHGVGRGLKQELDTRSDMMMALGVSSSAAPVLEQAGWRSGPGPRTWVRWQKPRGLQTNLRRWTQYPAAALGRISLGVVKSAGVDATFTSKLPATAELDRFWSHCKSGYTHCVVRDGALLEWRYARFPFPVYRYLVLRRNDELVAIGILRTSGSAIKLVDYVGPAHDLALKHLLVQLLIKEYAGATSVECTTNDRELQRVLLSQGFLPSAFESHRFFTRIQSAGASNDQSEDWFLMGGDSDGDFLDAARDACWTLREWSEEEFESSREQWEALLEQSAADRLFMSWEWQHGWWKHFAGRLGLRLRLVALYDHLGNLAGLAPFFEHRPRLPTGLSVTRLEPIGNTWRNSSTMRSEYLSVIVREDVSDEAARRLLLHLRDDIPWDELVVQDWNSKAPGDRAFYEVIGTRSLVSELTEPLLDETRFISLEHGFDYYAKQLSGNARRALLNQRVFLESLGALRIEYANAQEVPEYFHDLNRLHALRWGENVFSGERLAFHIELATQLAHQGKLRFSRLLLNDEVLSVLYHLRGGTREYNLQMGFNDRFQANRLSLGLLHLGYAIEAASLDGMQAVDLLAGAGKHGLFKQRFAPEAHQLVRRRYARSRVSRISVHLMTLLRSTAKMLPFAHRRYTENPIRKSSSHDAG